MTKTTPEVPEPEAPTTVQRSTRQPGVATPEAPVEPAPGQGHPGVDPTDSATRRRPTETPAATETPEPATSAEAVVKASGLELTASRGRVYGPLDLEVPAGWLMALVGPQGTGRTALLLTLAGRMKPSGGRLRVLGRDLPKGRRHVQSHAALANFESLDELDDALRVREVFSERAALVVPLWVRPLRWSDARAEELQKVVFGPDPVPDPNAQIWQLSPLQASQLRVLLALLGDPKLMLVDDTDTVRDPDEERKLWHTLQRVCSLGVTVVAAGTSTTAIPGEVRVMTLAPEEN